jgi:hypothetical protein
MPSLVQPAGGHSWRAFGGVPFVRETMRVGLAWGGGPCDGCLALEDWPVGCATAGGCGARGGVEWFGRVGLGALGLEAGL